MINGLSNSLNVIVLSGLIVLYLVFFYFIYRIRFKHKSRIYFFKSVKTVLEACSSESDCKKQIYMNFKQWSEKYPQFNRQNSPAQLLEELIFKYDSLQEKRFEEKYGIKLNLEDRKKIVNIIEVIKKENPFISLSPKSSSTLQNLKHSIESKNTDLATTMLNQLSNDIEMIESSLKNQKEINQISIIVSVIGIVLTIVFGIISI